MADKIINEQIDPGRGQVMLGTTAGLIWSLGYASLILLFFGGLNQGVASSKDWTTR